MLALAGCSVCPPCVRDSWFGKGVLRSWTQPKGLYFSAVGLSGPTGVGTTSGGKLSLVVKNIRINVLLLFFAVK